MFYNVEKEICGKGIKERYCVGQKINDSELISVKQYFSEYRYNFYEDLNELKLYFYDLDVFGNKTFIYTLNLLKLKY